MSYSLVLDTTSKFLVVGLGKDGNCIDEIKYEAWQRQSEFACLEISDILNRNDLNPSDIEEIVVSKGPGSYTGVRIALTIAKVWSITNKIKIKAISSLASIAGLEKAIVILDARSKRCYFGMYNNGKAIINDCIKEIDEIKQIISKFGDYKVLGDIKLLEFDEIDINYTQNMLNLAKITECVDDIDRLIPVYLKEAY